MNQLKWAPLIPLIGGFPLGAAAAFNSKPTAIISYSDFTKNDSHYVNYINEIHNLNVPYIHLDKDPDYSNEIDVIVGTPPCAALSQLNTGKTAAVKGAGCQKNEWMYRVFEEGIDRFNAKAVIVENAPALYTNKGQAVAQRLYEIAKARGYSLTLYKTSTMYHGIPQNRQRCFAIAWKSKTAPIMNWYDRSRLNFHDYLKNVNANAKHHDIIINNEIGNEHYYQFIKYKTNRDPRELLKESKIITTLQYVIKHFSLDEALDWFETIDHTRGAKYAAHAIKKYDQGLGVWDGSTHVFNEVMNAVIGRNMADTIHPEYDRSLTVREALYMMGFPDDFELLGGRSCINHIAQNVPVCTARDMCTEIELFIRGQLLDSGSSYVKQNNFKKTIEHVETDRHDLTSFIQ